MTANIIAGAAFVVSALALAVSWVYGHRNAVAADRSAKAAEASAGDAAQVRKAELEREHRDYTPVLDDPEFTWETNPRSRKPNQFLTFRTRKTYRVFGDTLHSLENGKFSRSPLDKATGGPFEAGVVQRVYVSAEGERQPAAVELRFFPPAAGDPGESWSCPCDRDSAADRHDKDGHWVVRLDIPPRENPIAAWG